MSRVNDLIASWGADVTCDTPRDAQRMQQLLRLAGDLEQDAHRLEWLVKRCDYIEHRDVNDVPANFQKVGGWWPVDGEEHSQHDPDMIRLDLIEYIDAQMAKEES